MGDDARFQIIRPLGVAGTTSVARDTSVTPSRAVILETLTAEAGGDPTEMRARARALASLEHPKVVPVRDVIDKDGGLLLVSDFVDGEWLSALMALDPKPPLEVLLRIVLDVLEGLAALHDLKAESGESATFVHGAVSPDTVLVADDGVAEIARAPIGPRAERGDRYVAPELRRGESPSDVKSDVYSVGAILKEVLGAAPATAKWAERFTDIAWRACSVDPENRWPSAAAMATTVRKVAGSKLASADEVADFLRKSFGTRMRARRAALDMLDEGPPSSSEPISIRPQDMLVIDPQSAPTLVQTPVASVPPPVPAKTAVARVALVKKAAEPTAPAEADDSEPETTRRPQTSAPAPAPAPKLSSPPAAAPMLPPPDIVPDAPASARAAPASAPNDAYRRRMPTFPTMQLERSRPSLAVLAMGIAAAMVATFGLGWWLGREHPPGAEPSPTTCVSTTGAIEAPGPSPLTTSLATPPPISTSGSVSSVSSSSASEPSAAPSNSSVPSTAASAPSAPATTTASAHSVGVRAPGTVEPPAPKPVEAPKPVLTASGKPPEPPKPPRPPGADGYVPSEL